MSRVGPIPVDTDRPPLLPERLTETTGKGVSAGKGKGQRLTPVPPDRGTELSTWTPPDRPTSELATSRHPEVRGRADAGRGRHGGSNYIEPKGNNGWTHGYNGVPSGGWGLQNGTTNYAGGTGDHSVSGDDAEGGFGGGGASVILDSNGNPLVVAGGGGGVSLAQALTYGDGGQGGYQCQLAGGNGTPNGGKAGANTVSQGQQATAAGGGAGGGGVKGGTAGSTAGEGGGAGSSFISAQIQNGAIQVAPDDNNNAGATSQIVITPTVPA